MIYLHRCNNNQNYPTDGIELDVRKFNNDIILSHNYINDGDNAVLLKDCINNFKDHAIIVDVKESGSEDYVNNLLEGSNIDYLFLNLQIPDMIKLSREGYSNFLIRASEIEQFKSIAERTLSDYVWGDYFSFDNFNIDNYINYISSLPMSEKTVLVSPELYGKNYLFITKEIINRLKEFKPKVKFSVCTDYPELWEFLND